MAKRIKSVEPMSDWTSLPLDLLVDIRDRVLKNSRCAEDFMSFKGVCSSWRAAAKDYECLLSPLNLHPFLMVPDKEGSRGFYSLSKAKVCMRLPMSGDKRCIESGFGWFLIQAGQRVDLLNPFTGLRIQLPEYMPFARARRHLYIDSGVLKRSVLSANPSSNAYDYVLVVLSDVHLAYWKPRNKNWTRIDMGNTAKVVQDVVYSNRDKRFYSIDSHCITNFMVWDAARDGVDSDKARYLFHNNIDKGQMKYSDKYLVESSDGELLLVTRRDNTLTSGVGSKFQVYQIDERGVGDKVTRIKDAILVSHNAAFCLAPPPDFQHIIQSNSIYFTGTLLHKSDTAKGMGIYSLEDGSFQRFHQPIENFSLVGPPLWVVPSSLSLH